MEYKVRGEIWEKRLYKHKMGRTNGVSGLQKGRWAVVGPKQIVSMGGVPEPDIVRCTSLRTKRHGPRSKGMGKVALNNQGLRVERASIGGGEFSCHGPHIST